jgi:hypothetical protein
MSGVRTALKSTTFENIKLGLVAQDALKYQAKSLRDCCACHVLRFGVGYSSPERQAPELKLNVSRAMVNVGG